jgi:hypothetical protein
MSITSSAVVSSKRSSRVLHVLWISALIFFVATPDGEGAARAPKARQTASNSAAR